MVFFSFWKSVLINMAARLGLITPAEFSTYDTDDVAAGLQNFLICLEMFAAAVAHAHAFPPRVRAPCCSVAAGATQLPACGGACLPLDAFFAATG